MCVFWCVLVFCANTHADPRVFQSLLRRDSLGWIDGQHLIDEVFGFRGDRVPLWRGELEDTWELMGMYGLNQLYWVKSQGDSRHTLQLWSVGRVCAGLHPKTEDIPPAEYTGWPLQSHYWYFTSNGFYAILCVLTILHLGTPKTTLNIIINTHINSIKKHIHI